VIYLDSNATTKPTPAVIDAVRISLLDHWENPSSVHRAGQAARRDLELARGSLADLIAARPREITFTGSGTESIDLAIRGVLAARRQSAEPPLLITTRVEHAAVRDLAAAMEREGLARVAWAPLTLGGVVDVAQLAPLVTRGVSLVSVQWANNETGAIQPVAEISRLCRAARVAFHCDATQWVGKMPVTRDDMAMFDLLSFSPHKFHSLKGVGVLWARSGVSLRPVIHGAQELGRRGGTENVPGIVGAGVAAEEARVWLGTAEERTRIGLLRDRFERAIRAAVPDAVINAADAPHGRLWNTTNIGFPRLEAEALLLLLSERGVCASAGAACSSGSLEPSPVLLAMGIPPEIAHGSLRFSLSRETTDAEIDAAVTAVVASVAILRASSAGALA
jgi:cysteine desulfurase